MAWKKPEFVAWSYSRWKTFCDCPKQLWHTAIAPNGTPDRLPWEENKHMKAGTDVDNALTACISTNAPLAPEYAKYQSLVDLVKSTPGHKMTQVQAALDRTFKVCGYKDWDNAFVRVIYDLAIVNGRTAAIWDWKNGMMLMDHDQLDLFAASGFILFPEVEYIDTAYVWLKHDQISPKSYRRSDAPELWQKFLPDVERMQIAFKTQTWAATPKKGQWGWNCKRCAVNKAGLCKEAAVAYVPWT